MIVRTLMRRIGPCAFGMTALLFCGLSPHCASAQQAVPPASALPSDPPPSLAPLFDDPHEAIRKGLLFYSVSPRTEKELEGLGETSAPFSVTIPIEVDRTNSRVYVAADLDGHKVRLILDTGGGPMVALNGLAGKELALQGQFADSMNGVQGDEPVTISLAQRLMLGPLMLGGVNVVLDHDLSPRDDCTLGTEIFLHYRVTLDFAAKTMTLSRGGVSAAAVKDSLSVPFREDAGKLYIPVRALGRSVWAMLDSGSDGNEMALSLAKSAAAQFPAGGSKELTLDGKIGAGDPKSKVNALVFEVPLPITLDTPQADALPEGFKFGTASQFGASFLEESIDKSHKIPATVKLGLPFFLQFRRVTIDYPNHLLTLEQPEHGTALFMAVDAKGPSKVWPGYEWKRVGDGWLEAPIKKAAPPVVSSTTTQTAFVKTGQGPITIVTPGGMKATFIQIGNGNVTVTVNGVSKNYPCPLGSQIKVDADGTVRVVPVGQ